jgi:biotin transporter BioY
VTNGKGLDRLRLTLGWTVTALWVASLIADAALPEYDVPATLHGLMLMVAGALFGPTITGRRKNGE